MKPRHTAASLRSAPVGTSRLRRRSTDVAVAAVAASASTAVGGVGGVSGVGLWLSYASAAALAFAAAVNIATGTPDHETGPLPVLTPLAADVIRAASNPLDPNHLVALAQAARRSGVC